MTARLHRPSFHPLLASRRHLGMVALGLLTVAGLLIPIEGAAVAAEKPPHHVSTDFERSLENGTVMADMKSGKVSDAEILDAGEHGLTVNGRHIDGWTAPTEAQKAQGEKFAAEMRADPKAAEMRGDAAGVRAAMEGLSAPRGGVRGAMDDLADADAGDVADASHPPALAAPAGASVAESKHWWNVARNWLRKHTPHWWINGTWFKALAAGGVAAGMLGVCIFFDFSKVSCGLIGALVAVTLELAKNSKCGRTGMNLYYLPLTQWLSYC